MYTVLIAEDEPFERTFLKKRIETSGLKIKHVYAASNGDEAIEFYKQYDCQIILMDISMPKKNGLEVLHEIRTIQKKQNICYILTSYDYFSYAQEAIQLHVDDFILKPADINYIIEKIEKAIVRLDESEHHEQQYSALSEKIKTTKPMLENECAHMIMTIQSEIVIQKYLKLLDIQFVSGFCIILNKQDTTSGTIDSIKEIIEGCHLFCITTTTLHDDVFFVIANTIVHEHEMDEVLTKINKDKIYTLGVGDLQYEIEHLYISYTHALINRQAFDRYEKACTINKLEVSIQHLTRELMEYSENNEDVKVKQKIAEMVHDCLRMEEQTVGDGSDFLQKVYHTLVTKLNEEHGILLEQGEQVFNLHQPVYVVENELVYQFYNLLRTARLMRYHQLDYLSKKARDFIEQNYMKQIGLNDVANALHVSMSYLSRVLNQNDEKGFSEVLNECRIRESKRLIREDIPMKEVAFRVGFRSQSYFAKTFKKIVGMSAKDYRNLF